RRQRPGAPGVGPVERRRRPAVPQGAAVGATPGAAAGRVAARDGAEEEQAAGAAGRGTGAAAGGGGRGLGERRGQGGPGRGGARSAAPKGAQSAWSRRAWRGGAKGGSGAAGPAGVALPRSCGLGGRWPRVRRRSQPYRVRAPVTDSLTALPSGFFNGLLAQIAGRTAAEAGSVIPRAEVGKGESAASAGRCHLDVVVRHS